MKYVMLICAVLLLILSGAAYSLLDIFGVIWGTISVLGGLFYLHLYNRWDREEL